MEEDTYYVISGLKNLRDRLTSDVQAAYADRGKAMGDERLARWLTQAQLFLDNNLPGQSGILRAKLSSRTYIARTRETPAQQFWRTKGDAATAYIDSLIMDIEQGEYVDWVTYEEEPSPNVLQPKETIMENRQVFIVHGHDRATTVNAARFVEKLGFEAIILDEQVSGNRTIIEKIEAYSDVGFALVLYTPDDRGNDRRSAEKGKLNFRARQNVVFEHGYLMAKIGRDRVVTLKTADVELPSDIHGMVYVTTNRWEIDVAKEMRNVGYEVDLNKLG